jgi:SNF2 family DNA or RNA helicase
LDGITATRGGKRAKSIEVPKAAVSVLEKLIDVDGALALDAGARDWRERFTQVWQKSPRLPKGFAGELRDYQQEGFRWLARLADLQLGACLAADVGLGKTVQLIALLLYRAAGGPALVVAPTSVCENWKREFARFAPSLSVSAYWDRIAIAN